MFCTPLASVPSGHKAFARLEGVVLLYPSHFLADMSVGAGRDGGVYSLIPPKVNFSDHTAAAHRSEPGLLFSARRRSDQAF